MDLGKQKKGNTMSTLVTFFSAEGTTAKVAKEFAERIGADIFEIAPVEPYTKSDINWKNPVSRCNREQMGGKDVPVAGKLSKYVSGAVSVDAKLVRSASEL